MKIDFSRTDKGWVVSDDVIQDLAAGSVSAESEAWCCAMFNSDGSFSGRKTIEADGRARAVAKCISLARDRGCPGGQLSRGACDSIVKDDSQGGDDRRKIETILRENLGKNFDLFFDTDEKRAHILREVADALEESELVETKEGFDRWKCARCVAINLVMGIAVAAAIAAFGPASPGIIPYVMQAFGLSESVATAIVVVVKGGGSGAMVAKKICKDC